MIIHATLLFLVSLCVQGKLHAVEDEIMPFVQPRGVTPVRQDKAKQRPVASDSEAEDDLKLPKGWSSCGSSSSLFQIHSIVLDPDPPRRSSPLRIHVKGNLAEPLTTGRLNYTVRYGIIPIVQDSVELCEALRMEPRIPQCPLRSGEWDVKHEVELPKETPFGRYSVEAAAWHEDGREIFCLKGTTVIGLLSAKKAQESEVEEEVVVVLEQVDDPEEAEEGGSFYNDVMRQVKLR